MALSDSQAIGSLPAWNDAVAPVAGQSVIAVIALTLLVALIALLSMTALIALVALHPLSVVIYLGEEPPLNRAERNSHPPASLRKPTAKKARPFTS